MIRNTLINTVLVLASLCFSTAATAAKSDEGWKGDAKDAWLEGRLETAYLVNTNLNNFRIDPDVINGNVTLSGTVASESDKALAERIAKSMTEVATVTNNLRVKSGHSDPIEENSKSFLRVWRDSTITAGLATEFTASPALKKRDINVDTDNGVVTLTGHVENEEAKKLAEDMAREYEHVSKVNNQLRVKKQ